MSRDVAGANETAPRRWALSFAALLAWIIVFNRETRTTPGGNEFVYLMSLAKRWNRDFLAKDWTFSGGDAEHSVFDFFFGPLTRFFSLETVAWTGRLLCWTAGLALLLRLGRRLGLGRGAAAGGILVWLFIGQSFVGAEWIFGTFEAKCVAYAFLFLCLDDILSSRLIRAGIWLGLSFSFHPAVGLWASVAILPALTLSRVRAGSILRFGAAAAAFSLPGLAAAVPMALKSPLFTADAEFLVRVQQPFHLDPFTFSKRSVAAVLAMAAWNLWRLCRRRRNETDRFFFFFQAMLAATFAVGILWRAVGAYRFLALFPFRLFPVITPLLFFWYWLSDFNEPSRGDNARRMGVGLLVALLVIGDPVTRAQQLLRSVPEWFHPSVDPMGEALAWVSRNIPIDAVVITPPHRKDAFFLTRRAQIANLYAARFDDYHEWLRRLEDVLGPLRDVNAHEVSRIRYEAMSEQRLRSLVERYGAGYLVTHEDWTLPVAFRSGSARVYRLDSLKPHDENADRFANR